MEAMGMYLAIEPLPRAGKSAPFWHKKWLNVAIGCGTLPELPAFRGGHIIELLESLHWLCVFPMLFAYHRHCGVCSLRIRCKFQKANNTVVYTVKVMSGELILKNSMPYLSDVRETLSVSYVLCYSWWTSHIDKMNQMQLYSTIM